MKQESDDTGPLWVFAYGSLMWRPGFDHVGRVRARMDGFRRAFCMWSIHYRGTEDRPGLVLALDPEPGASCEGIGYEVAPDRRGAVLDYLRERELVSYAYNETWHEMALADGRRVQAVAYVMNQTHAQYCGRIPLEAQAEIIAQSAGTMGPNADYLFSTVAHLQEMGCPDPEMEALERAVRVRLGEKPETRLG